MEGNVQSEVEVYVSSWLQLDSRVKQYRIKVEPLLPYWHVSCKKHA